MRFGAYYSISISRMGEKLGFSEIIGHTEIIKALESSLISGKTGHAYLFTGPAGVGKKTLARSFAIRLLCHEKTDSVDCGCRSCERFRAGVHPDFKVITPVGNSIKIEQLREIQHQAYLSPVMGDRKIYFFPDAEALTDVAANSFLKLLEEAPPGIIFLFTAIRLDNILPTIQSRCQVVHLYPVPENEVEAGLRRLGYSEEEVKRRSMLCQGLPGIALGNQEEEAPEDLPTFDEILQLDLLSLFKLAERFEKKERKMVISALLSWETQLRKKLLGFRGEGSLTTENQMAVRILEKFSQAMAMCEANVNIRLLLEELFIFIKLAKE